MQKKYKKSHDFFKQRKIRLILYFFTLICYFVSSFIFFFSIIFLKVLEILGAARTESSLLELC